MATLVLSAAGAALGGAVGGSVLGLSSMAIGRAIGATIGRRIDERLLGQGAEPVETGRVDRFRIMGAREGAAIPSVHGRMRIGGQVIWATRFRESISESGGGKGGGPVQRSYAYSVSLAVALCEGEIARVGRIWADGEEQTLGDLNYRVYSGGDAQEPDPLIEAVEGAGSVPAYRGTAYVVFEDLNLAPFGSRIPQFSFEVVRPVEASDDEAAFDIAQGVSGVALMPGTGEYALATTPVHFSDGIGGNKSANVNTALGQTDFGASLESLETEMPGCGAVGLIVSWLGDDLRIGACELKPKVEQGDSDGVGMPWRVAGVDRFGAEVVSQKDGLPVYGGTPCDASVIESISRMNSKGYDVMFYPFILMEQAEGNGLPDPWSDAVDQPVLPWRGRITSSVAAGRPGSPDGTSDATAEVEAFFGAAQASDFQIIDGEVLYSGPNEWSYRRFILHYAYLCALAGGVESFCIGSEMRGMTHIRGPQNSFPAVEALLQLAVDVRGVLGADTKIGYAADWSEYFGYHPQDGTGDVFFHLDPLWASDEIDFIGIDNYMPLSDWREGEDHADAYWGSVYSADYLESNIEGGEGFDWYYHSEQARDAQIRTDITDQGYGEDWVWRYKDIRGWWQAEHHNRIAGERALTPTDWVPQSKPVRFTEFGCAAIDKGSNQPNKFLDPKSSESGLPHYSTGERDELIQRQYFKAMLRHWKDEFNNPVSALYGAPMIDMGHAYAWAWDARPYPAFPTNSDLWSDAGNYATGHWLNGRSSGKALSAVLKAYCVGAGVEAVDAEQAYGIVRGYLSDGGDTPRSEMQPLLLAYGIDAFETGGQIVFRSRTGRTDVVLNRETLVERDGQGDFESARSAEGEEAGRVRVGFLGADGEFEPVWEDASQADSEAAVVSVSEFPLVLTRSEGRLVAERWLSEGKVARDRVNFSVPPSCVDAKVGSVIDVGDGAKYRIDRVESTESKQIEAVKVDPEAYRLARIEDEPPVIAPYLAPVPVFPLFLDLPLISGNEDPFSPHVAVTASPWPGQVGVFRENATGTFDLSHVISEKASVGRTESVLTRATGGVIDRGPDLQVKMASGTLDSASWASVLNGANRIAIGSGASDEWEVLQFAEAELIAPDTYLLKNRLRGQFGTDAFAPDEWPVGSIVVLLNEALGQVALSPSDRELSQRFRTGPVSRPIDDASFVETEAAFSGVGLRPFSPCHLHKNGDLFTWVRRTRVGGDAWTTPSVPIGEESEVYVVRVLSNGQILREVQTTSPSWTYDAATRVEDGNLTAYSIAVAQVSAVFGAGGAAVLDVVE